MHTKNVDGQLHGLYLEALCDGLDNALNPYRYVCIAILDPYTIKSSIDLHCRLNAEIIGL